MSRGWTNLLGGPAAEEPEPAAGPGFSDRMKEALGLTPRASSGDGNVLADLRSSLRPSGTPAEEAGTASFLSGITTSLDRSTRSLQTAVGLREEEPPTLLSELDAATTMSYQTRFYAFWISLVIGFSLSLLAWLFYFNDSLFAVVYTLGNLVALSSSAFFWGPKTYLSMMFKKNRWMISLAVLGTMGFTLFCVFAIGEPLVTMAAVALQSACLFWYTISYIPFMRACLKTTAGKCFGALLEDDF